MNLNEKLKHYRLSSHEYSKISETLGREPQGVEWAIFSALWSEHCSYKSSKIHLKKLSQTLTSRALKSEGENAGIVDLGQGEKIAFKMESHNHPSFIEPYQGAATGVGGILRDIFTMGARPIALADYLCFGEPSLPHMQKLIDGVVRGISGYGNCVGVPTVTGQTSFDESYNQNILVNAMAVGLFTENEAIAYSAARGVGNWVIYVGAKTGKDGVHGAAMASESFADDTESKKPNVQIGDPYFEKLLIESCLEVIQSHLVVAIQDMGAAGLTSSSFEMAAKGQVGMNIYLDQVPIRDSSITPEEILLSESQERMLLICQPHHFEKIHAIFSRWGLDSVKIGEVSSDQKINLFWHGEKLTSINPQWVVDQAPVYDRPFQKPVVSHAEPKEYYSSHEAKKLCQSIYRQYDQRVGLRTVRGADHDVAIMKLPSGRGLSLAVGCRPYLMKMDVQRGARDAIIYPSLQMAIKGARPLAATDCLNFGNPEKIEVMSQFVTSIDSIVEVSCLLGISVVSGNVSFYNESHDQNICPTPATGIIGLRENVLHIPEDIFQKVGSSVYVVGQKNIPIKEWSQFLEQLIEISQLSLSSQMVSRGGISRTIQNMSEKLALPKGDWLQESDDRFYQAIFEISSENVKKFENYPVAKNFLGFVGVKNEFMA